MRILVTGGAGFIGSHLVNKLSGEDHEVFVIDDLSGGSTLNITDEDKFEMIDCRDDLLVDEAFKRIKPEVVFHLAANAAEGLSHFSPIEVTSRNYDAFIKTVTPAIKYGVKRFVFTSSIAAYGAIPTPFKESDRPEPEDLYGISKYACEMSLKILSEVHGMEYVITRPHNVYGPKQNMKDPLRNVVTIWMNALLKGEPYYIYGDGSMQRCFSYIDDVVDALYKCGFADVLGKTFNVGSDSNYTLSELSRLLQKVAGNEISPIYLPQRANEVTIAISDHTEAKKYLNYQDTVSLEEGLRRTWEWAESVGYQQPIISNFEIDSPLIPNNWRTI